MRGGSWRSPFRSWPLNNNSPLFLPVFLKKKKDVGKSLKKDAGLREGMSRWRREFGCRLGEANRKEAIRRASLQGGGRVGKSRAEMEGVPFPLDRKDCRMVHDQMGGRN